METVNLKSGDELTILPETRHFLLGCCKCDLIHKIKVKRNKENIILKFLEYKK